MPSAPIASGVFLHYEDSGVPPSVDHYTTLVLVHGLAFNGGVFEPMLPFAPPHGVRILTVNMRDYAGSTPYSAEELGELVDKDVSVQTKAVQRVSREIAAFLVYVCTELGIPPIDSGADGKTVDGLVLLAWSMHTMGALALLGDEQVLDQPMQGALSPFLRKVIFYDPPLHAYGADRVEEGLTHPFVDDSISAKDKPAAFMNWVTAYNTPLPDDLPRTITLDALRERTAHDTPTIDKMSASDVQKIVEPGVMIRSGALLATYPEIHRRNTARALFDARDILPGVDVLALWCDSSPWTTVLAARLLDHMCNELPANPGQCKRAVSIVKVQDGNHLYHWDEPENMVKILVENI